MTDGIAVCARNVSFSYGRGKHDKNLLDNVNITVPCGVIYGLLGPSGCGKTTLLKIITGRKPLRVNNGRIVVFGQDPLTKWSCIPGPGVGFMPQELSLHNSLTVRETLTLFGRLNGMKCCILDERIKLTCRILQLAQIDKLLETLSGGQQRRVSMAVAMLHDPPLLILDEPTVGVDPMLRKKIWSHLASLAKTKNTTIIITTHYINEAKEANLVGVMRHGRIVAESEPYELMKTLNCTNLEACFSKLCLIDESSSRTLINYKQETWKTQNNELKVKDHMDFVDTGVIIDTAPRFYEKTKIMWKRNMILINRHKILLMFQLLVPLFEVIAFCTCMGRPLSNLRVAVVNEESGTDLAYSYVNSLDTNVVMNRSYNFNDAIKSVESGENVAAIHMGQNFTQCLKDRLEYGLDASNQTILCGSVSVHFDLTNLQIYYTLYQSLLDSYQSFYEKLLSSLGKATQSSQLPIDFSKPIIGSTTTTYGEYIIPGMICIILFYLAAAVSLLKLIQEKSSGVEDRLWVNGVTKMNLLFSHFIAGLLVAIVQTITMLPFAFYVYQLPLVGSIFTLGLLALSQSVSGLAFGFALSSFFSSEGEAFMIGNGIMVSHMFISGIIWPIEGMTNNLKMLAYFLPITMPSEAFKSIASKGWGLGHLQVQLGFLSSFSWLFIFMGCTVLKLKLLK